jgi:hypothetical protein
VKLFALGGYGLAQAYLRFNDIKDSLKPDDIIVLGYADFYDVRNVVAPSWLQEKRDWIAEKNPSKENESSNLLPSASLVDGKIGIAYIQENCLHNGGYCESTDPDRLEMTKVSAALINYIAHNTLAKVYLLHFHGNAENPVFQQVNGVTHISALPGDFDYFIQDDIEGFDPHPGPFWHYAISRKLIQVLSSN